MNYQSGILEPITSHARYLMFSFESEASMAAEALNSLTDIVDGVSTVIGLGPSMISATGKHIPGLRPFPSLVCAGIDIPVTQHALWLWLRSSDRGELFHRSRYIENALASDFQLREVLDGFIHADCRDLSGYEDGTENPKGEEAVAASIVQGQGAGLDGSSFVAVQQWLHDFELLNSHTEAEQDNIIGRRISDNQELADAPPSAHVKRAAQESYDPEAFVLRRSMPWTEGTDAGLNFVAFGKSLDAYEVILTRMAGHEDGLTDALFTFTRPISGGYYWCPPMKDGLLDLSALIT